MDRGGHIQELKAEIAKLQAVIAEALSGMEYYSPSLGEMASSG